MEKFILKKVKLASLLALCMGLAAGLSACEKAPLEEVEGLAPYTILNDQFFQKDNKILDGTGVIRFDTNLPAISSAKSVEVRGSLREANSSIAVLMFSSDLNLNPSKGVIFKVTRPSAVTDAVKAQITVQNAVVDVQDIRMAYLSAANLEFIVEVHNTASTTRVLVWRRDVGTPVLANVEVDTTKPSHLTGSFPTGAGDGIFAGLSLVNAKVTTQILGDAKVVINP